MELSNDEPNTRLQDGMKAEEQYEDSRGEDWRSSQAPRLQKQRSNPGSKPANRRPQTFAAAATNPITGGREGNKGRKPSIRNAIRKVFGRRLREPEPEPEPYQKPSPPHHAYHKSEPTALTAQPEVPEAGDEEDEFIQRTFSVPVAPIATNIQRARSPYAVEFPQSSRLKPINLGSPFTAPGSTLRRRKTLPSLLIAGSDAEAVREAVQAEEDGDAFESSNEPRPSEIGMALSGAVNERRKSRSADDLRFGEVGAGRLSRKRSEEIQFWRQSVHAPVLRASGFRAPSPAIGEDEEKEEDKTPLAQMPDPFVGQGDSSTLIPPTRRPQDATPSALGTELSQDLEDRVARLEAGLRDFRGELAQMAADRNRRTILIGSGGVGGSSTRPRRVSSGDRTASMLAETLASDIEPSNYQYDYSGGARPSTSPEPPRTPTRFSDASAAVPAVPVYPSEEDYRSPSPSSPPTATAAGNSPRHANGTENGHVNGAQPSQTPQYTFRSLYEMLTDERSARRRLESQMRSLREEIANLNYQVSLQSNIQSQRSSYYAVGSNRLQALLRETEDSPPRTANNDQRASGITVQTGLSAETPRFVSRFSGSESESGLTDLQTPQEAYQTPAEEQPNFSFGEALRRDEGEMF